MGLSTGDIITAVIGVVLGLSLFPVVTSAITTINATAGTIQDTLLDLIPVLYIIMLIVGIAGYLYVRGR
jgi:uncharacterized membrane protein